MTASRLPPSVSTTASVSGEPDTSPSVASTARRTSSRPENGARHLVADVKAPAAALMALAVDDGERGRAGADDDHRAVFAAKRAGVGDVDIVIDADRRRTARARCSNASRVDDRAARRPCRSRHTCWRFRRNRGRPWRRPRAWCLRGSSGRRARRSGSAGWTARPGLAQGHQILVGEADAAIGASAVNAKVISGHVRPRVARCAARRRGRTIMPMALRRK